MYTPNDPQADAAIIAETNQEHEAILKVCNHLGLEIFQVTPTHPCDESSLHPKAI
jgi:hypothetical protein